MKVLYVDECLTQGWKDDMEYGLIFGEVFFSNEDRYFVIHAHTDSTCTPGLVFTVVSL